MPSRGGIHEQDVDFVLTVSDDVTYSSDGLGRRVARNSERYLYDGQTLRDGLMSGNVVLRRYLYSPTGDLAGATSCGASRSGTRLG